MIEREDMRHFLMVLLCLGIGMGLAIAGAVVLAVWFI